MLALIEDMLQQWQEPSSHPVDCYWVHMTQSRGGCKSSWVCTAQRQQTWRRSLRWSGYRSSSSRAHRAAWRPRASSACSPPPALALAPRAFPPLSESLPLPPLLLPDTEGDTARPLPCFLDLDRLPCFELLLLFSLSCAAAVRVS